MPDWPAGLARKSQENKKKSVSRAPVQAKKHLPALTIVTVVERKLEI
jgi:hypothetical protein